MVYLYGSVGHQQITLSSVAYIHIPSDTDNITPQNRGM